MHGFIHSKLDLKKSVISISYPRTFALVLNLSFFSFGLSEHPSLYTFSPFLPLSLSSLLYFPFLHLFIPSSFFASCAPSTHLSLSLSSLFFQINPSPSSLSPSLYLHSVVSPFSPLPPLSVSSSSLRLAALTADRSEVRTQRQRENGGASLV